MVTNRVFLGVNQDASVVQSALDSLPGVNGIKPLASEAGCRFEVRGDFGDDLTSALANLARENQWQLRELNESPYSLEDTFISYIQRSGKGVA